MSQPREQFRGLAPNAVTLEKSANMANAPSGKSRIWIETNGTTSTLKFNDSITDYDVAGSNVPSGGGGGALGELTDVTLATESNLDYLKYNGSDWVNSKVGVVTYNGTKYVGNTTIGDTAFGEVFDDNITYAQIGRHNTAIGTQALNANTRNQNQTAIGYRALATHNYHDYGLGDYGQNTAIGAYALEEGNNAMHSNVAIGAFAGRKCSSYQNVFVGYKAAASTNTVSGTGLVVIGSNAGKSLTSGGSNTLVGQYAGNNLTSGDSNTALGQISLSNCLTGSNNVAIGVSTMSSALSSLSNTTAVGYGALSEVDGINNTAIGYQAGNLIQSGTNNTIVGHDADVDISSRAGCTIIGSNVVSSADNQFIVATGGSNKFETTFSTTGNSWVVEFNNSDEDVFIPLITSINPPGTANAGKFLKYDGTQWLLDTAGGGATTLNELTDVILTSESLDNVIAFNGTEFVNTPRVTFERFSVAGGSNQNPDLKTQTTFVKTTGTGTASGNLLDGIIDGQVKHIIGQSLVVDYVLNGTNTTLKEANGSVVTTVTYASSSNNSTSFIWDNDGLSWYVMGTGAALA